MKNFLLSTLIFFSFLLFTLNVTSDEVDHDKIIETRFSISCKVLDLVLLGMEDGISKGYTGIDDVWNQITIGKEFYINVDFTETSLVYYLNFRIPDFSLWVKWDKWGIGNKRISNVEFNENIITFRNILYPYQLSMKRYFKNDWQFKLAGSWSSASYIVTANCMNMPSSYTEFLKSIKGKNLNNRYQE